MYIWAIDCTICKNTNKEKKKSQINIDCLMPYDVALVGRDMINPRSPLGVLKSTSIGKIPKYSNRNNTQLQCLKVKFHSS